MLKAKRDASSDMPEYPANFEVKNLPGRAALRTARFFAVAAALSLLLNIVLGGALVGLAPLKETRPFMVQFEQKSDVVSTIRPIQAEVEGLPLLVESLVRKYVIRRESIPRTPPNQNDLLADRWGPGSFVALASTGGVYDAFASQVVELIPELRDNGVRREVRIRSVAALRPLRLYQVEYQATLYGPDESVRQESVLQATMEVDFKQTTGLTREEALENPTGFTVTSYNRVRKAE